MAKRATVSARDFLPDRLELDELREAARSCRGCDLYKIGTQTVFGEGPHAIGIMMVGEQPGDHEDLAGRPFVGPAGKLLDRALGDAKIPRDEVYVTNAVKHFKWKPVGKRRIHEKPGTREVRACRPWLEAEIKTLSPQVIVCLGATAAQSLMGPSFRVTQHRGEILETPWAPRLIATVHPSSLLRMEDDERETAYEAFVEDLSLAREVRKRKRVRLVQV